MLLLRADVVKRKENDILIFNMYKFCLTIFYVFLTIILTAILTVILVSLITEEHFITPLPITCL